MTIDKTKLALVLFVAFATIITCVNPIYPHEQLLQHIGTALLFIPLITDVFKKAMPMSAFIGLACFTILHVIGARYIYSYVPYKELAVSLGLVDTSFFQEAHRCFYGMADDTNGQHDIRTVRMAAYYCYVGRCSRLL